MSNRRDCGTTFLMLVASHGVDTLGAMMSPSTAALFAQIIPVFFLAVILESRRTLMGRGGQRKFPRVKKSLGISFGAIFVGTLVSEFLFLGYANSPVAVVGGVAVALWISGFFFIALLAGMAFWLTFYWSDPS